MIEGMDATRSVGRYRNRTFMAVSLCSVSGETKSAVSYELYQQCHTINGKYKEYNEK